MKINPVYSYNKQNSFKSNEQASNTASYINNDRMCDYFVKIAKIDTSSNPNIAGKQCPTTEGQIILGKILKDELENMGLVNVEHAENGFVKATLAANVENKPKIALLAHMDTSSDANSKNITPIIHDYKNGDIVLKNNQTITQDELNNFKNTKIITSDGTTLLGADDKAGISEIIEALNVFIEHPELKHPEIQVIFTPDEEGAGGIKNLDLSKINANVAYTIDGINPTDIDTETFNAYNPMIIIKGVESHRGYAYQKMVSSINIACEFVNSLPENEKPETTKGKEGYYSIEKIEGNISQAKIKMLVRDFDSENINNRIDNIKNIISNLQNKYPKAQIEFIENKAYENIKNNLDSVPEIIEYTKKGIEKSGIVPLENSVRGGTDGSYLTQNGLLCPNLGAGGQNFHTYKEFISLESMKKCCENIINIIQVWADENNPFD